MNINQLRFAQAVAQYRSFSRAAQHCHVTQPTLSNGIAQLETELEAKLFERTTRYVKLTPFGKRLLSSIEKTLADVEEIRSLAKAWRHPEQKLIRIGLSPIVDMRLLQDLLMPFREDFPDVEFFFKECFVNDLDARLNARQIDMMMLPSRKEPLGLQEFNIYSEPLLYLPRSGGTLTGSDKAVDLRDVAGDELILTMDGCGLRPLTLRLFEENGQTIQKYPGQAISYPALEDWTSLGIAGGILPKSKISAGNQLKRRLILQTGEPAMVTLQLVLRMDASANAPLMALVEYLKDKGHPSLSNVVKQQSPCLSSIGKAEHAH